MRGTHGQFGSGDKSRLTTMVGEDIADITEFHDRVRLTAPDGRTMDIRLVDDLRGDAIVSLLVLDHICRVERNKADFDSWCEDYHFEDDVDLFDSRDQSPEWRAWEAQGADTEMRTEPPRISLFEAEFLASVADAKRFAEFVGPERFQEYRVLVQHVVRQDRFMDEQWKMSNVGDLVGELKDMVRQLEK